MTCRTFRFNDSQRNTIHKTNNIRSAGIDTAGPQYRKFFRKMELVIFRMFPVNECNRGVDLLTIDKLRDGDSVKQMVVHPLIGFQQPVIQRR